MLKKAIFLSLFAFAFVTSASAAIAPVTPSKDTEGCYLIKTKEELYGFAAVVNSGDVTDNDGANACGKLIGDIIVNQNLLKEDGSLNKDVSDIEVWIPLGEKIPYMGKFDGVGHTISGLYCSKEKGNNVGLFSMATSNAEIKNVGVIDSYFQGLYYVAALVGYASANVSISNVYTIATLDYDHPTGAPAFITYPVGSIVGGIGTSSAVSIENSWSISLGKNKRSSIGYVSDSDKENQHVHNVFYRDDAGCAYPDFETSMSEMQFADGTLTALLRGDDETSIWGQNVTMGDKHPVFGKVLTGAVYSSVNLVMNNSDVVPSYTPYYAEGFVYELPVLSRKGYRFAGWCESSDLSDPPVFTIPASAKGDKTYYAKFVSLVAADGCYELGTADELKQFASLVNEGNASASTACVRLMNDIVLNKNVLDANGGLSNNAGSFEQWIPIGSKYLNPFKGSFDGQNHTISGLYVNKTEGYESAGLFGYTYCSDRTKTVSFKNVKIKGSFILYKGHVGGILGYNSDCNLDIDNVSYEGTVYADESNGAGGIVGFNYNYVGTVKISNASVKGSVYAKSHYVGGIIGYTYGIETDISNASFDGTVRSYGDNVGGIIGESQAKTTIGNVDVRGAVQSVGNYVGGIVGYYYSSKDFLLYKASNHASVEGKFDIGGLVGYSGGDAQIIQSFNEGNVTAYSTNDACLGGLVGFAGFSGNELSIINSYNTGTINGNNKVGGLIGDGSGLALSVINSFNAGKKISSGPDNGMLVGNATSPVVNVLNSFYNESWGVDKYGIPASSSKFADGGVAIMLHDYENASLGVNGSVWGQNIPDEKNPVLSETITGVTASVGTIYYHLSDNTTKTDRYVAGIEKTLPDYVDGKLVSKWYKESSYSGETMNSVPWQSSGDIHLYGKLSAITIVNGCYQIGDADDLYDFATIVNSESSNACGELTNDIVVNTNVVSGNKTGLREWTAIGLSTKAPYKGSFNGNGHVIYGLYSENAMVSGLFGYVQATGKSVIIKNVGVADSYLEGSYVGGLAYSVTVDSDASASIENAFFVGRTYGSGNGNTAGLIARAYLNGSMKIVNSYTDILSGTTYGYPLIGYVDNSAKLQVENSYYRLYNGMNNVKYGQPIGQSAIESGSLAIKLHDYSNVSMNGSIWGQNVTAGDKYPNFAKNLDGAKTVMSKVFYHNANGTVTVESYAEGFEKLLPTFTSDEVSYWYATEDFTGTRQTKIAATATGDVDFYEKADIRYVDNCYEIYSYSGLTYFASYVNNGETKACGKLMKDIVANENLYSSNVKQWKPIGYYGSAVSNSNTFQGTFDGQGHTISGLVTSSTSVQRAGLFGTVAGSAVIKNVGVIDSWMEAKCFAGAIAGYANGSSLNISNVYNLSTTLSTKGTCSSTIYAGGFVGKANNGSVTITNSYDASINETTGTFGSYVGYSNKTPTYRNCFTWYNESTPSADFWNGTVASSLHYYNANGVKGSIWGQNIVAGDYYPNFSGKIEKTMYLTWDDASEKVNMSSLTIPDGVELVIKNGKQFYANGKIYEGELTAEDIQELKTASATLKPISGIALSKDGDGEGVVATLSGSKSTDELVVPEDITVEHIEIARNFTAGRFSTLMLPFSMDLNEDMEDVLQITDVQKDGDQWVATGTRAKSIVANTPYLIKFNKNASISVDNVTLKATTGEIMESTSGPWTFRGAYKGKTWVEGDPELGKVYGFAGVNEGDNIVAGQFVKAGVGASVPPMRAYLVYNKPVVSPKPGVGLMKAAANEAEELPKTIVVRIVDDNNEVVDETVIEDVIQGIAGDNLNTVDKKPARWYDLQGRHLNGKPTACGAYFKNNKAIVNK